MFFRHESVRSQNSIAPTLLRQGHYPFQKPRRDGMNEVNILIHPAFGNAKQHHSSLYFGSQAWNDAARVRSEGY